jgi:Ras family protein A
LQWYPEVLHFCPYTPLVLLGLKSDLRHKRNCIELLRTQGLTPVTRDQGEAVARKMGARYMECSSKEMQGVDRIFEDAIDIVVGADRSHDRPVRDAGHAGARRTGGDEGGFTAWSQLRRRRNCRML